MDCLFGTRSGIWKINPVCEYIQPKRCILSQEQFIRWMNTGYLCIHIVAICWVLEGCKRWEQEQLTQENCQDTVPVLRDGLRKAKALLELNLERGGKKTWWKRPRNSRSTSAQSLLVRSAFRNARSWDQREKSDQGRLHLDGGGSVWGKFKQTVPTKSVRPDGIGPWELSELPGVLVVSLSMISESQNILS